MVKILSVDVEYRRRLQGSIIDSPQPVHVEYALVLPRSIDAGYVLSEAQAVPLERLTKYLSWAATTRSYFAVTTSFAIEAEAVREAPPQESESPVGSLAIGFGALVCIPIIFAGAYSLRGGKLWSLSSNKVHPAPSAIRQCARDVPLDVGTAWVQPAAVYEHDEVARLEAGTSTTDLMRAAQVTLPPQPKRSIAPALPSLARLPSWHSKSDTKVAQLRSGMGLVDEQSSASAPKPRWNLMERIKLPSLSKEFPEEFPRGLPADFQRATPSQPARIAGPTLLTAPKVVQPPSNVPDCHYLANSCMRSEATPSDASLLRAAAQVAAPPPIVSWREQQGIKLDKLDTDHSPSAAVGDWSERKERHIQQQLNTVQNDLALVKSQCGLHNIPGVPGLRKVELSQRLISLSQTQRELHQQLRDISTAKAVVKAEQNRATTVRPPPYEKGMFMSQRAGRAANVSVSQRQHARLQQRA